MPEYHLECPDNCSLREGTPWGAQATEMLIEKKSLRAIIAAAAADNVKLQLSSLSRHGKHIVLAGAEIPEDVPAKANNIEILETIIQKGFQNAKNWKPTISDTMKAMDMWFRLTQGNPFDDLLDTLAAASIGEEEPETERDPANGTADEVAVEIEDDDPEG